MMYGLHRSVSTMDDAPSVGCRGTFTAGTASAVTRQSDSGKADFSASDTGVDGCRVCLSCANLSSGSLFLGQGSDLLLSCPELSLKRRAPTAAVSCHVFPALCAEQRVHVGETNAFKDLGIRQLFRSI